MSNPFVKEIVQQLVGLSGVPSETLTRLIEVPPDPDLGDYALPCFSLAKTLRKAPNRIAEELAGQLNVGGRISEARAVGPYVNFFVRPASFVQAVLSKVLAEGRDYGRADVGKEKRVVIDFSHPNVAKPFGIHHLRSTVIGNALRNIFRVLGYEVIGINHLGDWGTQFAKLIAAWKRWGKGELTEGVINVEMLLDLYVRVHEEIEDDPAVEEEARNWLRRLEDGDPETRRMWQVCVNVSLKEFERIYDMLGITFESVAGESFYQDKIPETLKRLEARGLTQISEGATIVDLQAWDMPPFMALRSDDATLYATRDLAAAEYRWETYRFDRMLYVVDLAQSLYFKQLFKVLELMGHKWDDRCVHVLFGRLRFKDRTMSTRRGQIVFLEDVLNKAVDLTRAIIDEKNPNLPDKEQVAREVGIGAVIFADLDSRRARDVVFDWEEVLNFNGETGPYVQYTHARYSSVLRNSGRALPPSDVDFSLLTEPETLAVVKCLEQFPARIERAAETYEPSIIATYLIDLCTVANRFYNTRRVILEDAPLTSARVALVYAITTVLAAGLDLLGMKAPKQM